MIRNFINFITTLIIFSFISHCNYKPLSLSGLENYKIVKIETEGERRIGYKLKNLVLLENKNDASIPLNLNFNITKTKSINEKNINNKITKYKIDINVVVTMTSNIDTKVKTFNVTKSGIYDSSDKYTADLKSEKNLINSLTDNLADDILKNIIIKINEL